MNNKQFDFSFSILASISIFISFVTNAQMPLSSELKPGLLAEVYVSKISMQDNLQLSSSTEILTTDMSEIEDIKNPKVSISVPIAMGVPPFTGRDLDRSFMTSLSRDSQVSETDLSGLKWQGFIYNERAGRYSFRVLASGAPTGTKCFTGLEISDQSSGPTAFSARQSIPVELSTSLSAGNIPISLWVNCNSNIVTSDVKLDIQLKADNERMYKTIGPEAYLHAPR